MMSRKTGFCLGIFFAGGVVLPAAVPVDAEALFALKVRPLLVDKCFPCHGADSGKIKGGLNLMTREAMLRGGDTSDRVLVPGRASDSDLYIAVTWANEDLEMPPKENDRLTEEQTWLLRDWINGGAPWPDDNRLAAITAADGRGVTVTTSGGLSDDWTNRRYEPENLWAYQPVRKSAPSESPAGNEPRVIDDFIDRRLQDAGLPAAPLADRRTLIRRASYDLTGLPPTPEEIETYLRDPADEDPAFETVIERLLASPHYGEHWGRHWLDVVRYADSSGFANDYERGTAWRYRDYVVRAFNEDKPYDRFIREQLAGDELYEAQPAGARDPELLIAAGFLRMGPWELTGMEVAKVARQRFLDDVTDSVGQVFLGHMLQCARCHDHKFDPIPTRDYYRLQAVFASTQLADRPAPFLEVENLEGLEERRVLESRRAEFSARLTVLDRKEETAARQWAADHGHPYVPRSQGLKEGIPEELLPPKHVGFSVADYGNERISRKGRERLAWQLDRYEPIAFSVYSGATPPLTAVYQPLRLPEDRTRGELEETAILTGGDPFSPSLQAPPGVISAVAAFNEGPPDEITSDVSGRRTQLAGWIASDRNPLTARVMVNRIWQWHFGRAIAANPNNFGTTGGKPTHPDLLDWLAATFMEQGWSVKSMHRVIMMSQTYRRSARHPDPRNLAERDPTGILHARFQPRRLTAEELRDSMLAVSGELNRRLGGIPNRPEMNREAALQPRMVMGTFAEAWQPNPRPEQRHCRSIYALKLRGLPDPFMEVFNQPSPELSCEARENSTVTPQVFSLFNSESTLDRAVAFADRLMHESATPEDTVTRAFLLAFGREPADDETRWCLAHWRKMTARHETLEIPRNPVPTEIVRQAVEENTGERFEFVETLEFNRELVPDLKLSDVDPATRGLAELCLVLFNSNEFVHVY